MSVMSHCCLIAAHGLSLVVPSDSSPPSPRGGPTALRFWPGPGEGQPHPVRQQEALNGLVIGERTQGGFSRS
jgi:hypothetical protein